MPRCDCSQCKDLVGILERTTPRVGRNDQCPCGSGKKYKKCCIDKDANDTYEAKDNYHQSGQIEDFVKVVKDRPDGIPLLVDGLVDDGYVVARRQHYLDLARWIMNDSDVDDESLDLGRQVGRIVGLLSKGEESVPLDLLLPTLLGTVVLEPDIEAKRKFSDRLDIAVEAAWSSGSLEELKELISGATSVLERQSCVPCVVGGFMLRSIAVVLADTLTAKPSNEAELRVLLDHVFSLMPLSDPLRPILENWSYPAPVVAADPFAHLPAPATTDSPAVPAEPVVPAQAVMGPQPDVNEWAATTKAFAAENEDLRSTLESTRTKFTNVKAQLKERHDERNLARREVKLAAEEVARLKQALAEAEAPEPEPEPQQDDEFETRIRFPVLADIVKNKIRTEAPKKVARMAMDSIGRVCAGIPMSNDGMMHGGHLKGYRRVWVGRSYRLIYTVTDDEATFVDLVHRQDLDKWIRCKKEG